MYAPAHMCNCPQHGSANLCLKSCVLVQAEVQEQSLSPLLESEMLPVPLLALETCHSVLAHSIGLYLMNTSGILSCEF